MRELQVLCKNEIRYRADEGTERAKELIKEVNEQIQRHNAMTGMTPCPYSYQFATKESVPLDGLVIKRLRDIRDALTEARNLNCVCSGFTLQYEQGCQCDKQKKIDACEKALWDEIASL